MKLFEFQAKKIFARKGLRIPKGELIHSPGEAYVVAQDMGSHVVLKPQLSVKGRGKEGAILFAQNPEEAQLAAQNLFDMSVKGEKVNQVLVERKLDVLQELYVAVTVDYNVRKPVLIVSQKGGVEIEEIVKHEPEAVRRLHFSLLDGLSAKDRTEIREYVGSEMASIAQKLTDIFREYDTEIVEINPVIKDSDNTYWAADAVLNVNDDALYRQEKLTEFNIDVAVEDSLAAKASARNWTYIGLDGDIAILSSGAGLTMAILDIIHSMGGAAANFLDTAQIDSAGIFDAFDLIEQAEPFKVLLVNIFAGLNRCDELAQGIINRMNSFAPQYPIVIRMVGNMEQEGHDILKKQGLPVFTSLERAIEHAIELTKREKHSND